MTDTEVERRIPVNSQPIEKKSYSDDFSLEIREIFPTIQGEGPFTGHRAAFVRLAGCNLQCPGCDTDYTSTRQVMSPTDIVNRVRELMPKGALVVITGGEPFRQDITPLCRMLILHGYHIQVETNGTLPPSPSLPGSVVIVCSPKSGSINRMTLQCASAFKYVMAADSVDEEDGLPTLALAHSAKPRVARPPEGDTRPVYLQPMDSKEDHINWANLQACAESCMKHGYILQLQVHKIIDME